MNAYNEEFKAEVVEEYQKTKSIKKTCEKYQIAKSTVYKWQKELRSIEEGLVNINNYQSITLQTERKEEMIEIEINGYQIKASKENIKELIRGLRND